MKVKQFIKQETVLSVAIVLAAISAVFVPPDNYCSVSMRRHYGRDF